RAVRFVICPGATFCLLSALWTGLFTVTCVWVSNNYVATFEHAIVDRYHSLSIRTTFGTHVNDRTAGIVLALIHCGLSSSRTSSAFRLLPELLPAYLVEEYLPWLRMHGTRSASAAYG